MSLRRASDKLAACIPGCTMQRCSRSHTCIEAREKVSELGVVTASSTSHLCKSDGSHLSEHASRLFFVQLPMNNCMQSPLHENARRKMYFLILNISSMFTRPSNKSCL